MSIIQTMTDDVLSDFDTCPECGAALPRGALFCGSCGERMDQKKGVTGLLQDEQEISARYRILSLIRRRPSVNLYLALDLQPSARGRMVAMRDLDLSSCDEQARLSVIEQAQREYDLLRHRQPPHVMRAVDLCYSQGHLYTVAGFAPHITAGESARPDENDGHGEADAQQSWPRLTTLQDFLQSGQGLPSERRALHIVNCLCMAADRLHSQHIIIGDLDPSTVILNGTTVDDQVGLMISWLPPGAREALSLETSAPLLSYFIAPEALQGEAEARSDIYSLGAIFYLLLTGMPPEESSLRHRSRLRAPHEINPRMSLHISESVMQALAIDPNERFRPTRLSQRRCAIRVTGVRLRSMIRRMSYHLKSKQYVSSLCHTRTWRAGVPVRRKSKHPYPYLQPPPPRGLKQWHRKNPSMLPNLFPR